MDLIKGNRVSISKWKNFVFLSLMSVAITANAFASETQSASLKSEKKIDLESTDKLPHINYQESLTISGDVILSKLVELQSENNSIKNDNEQLQKQLSEALSTLKRLESLQFQNSELQSEMSTFKEKQRTPSWVEWIGILLASVAAIITTFGVFIAIFSFFGYKKIIDESKNVAEAKVEKTIPELLPEYTKRYLIELIEDGSFNEIIENSVAKVTFRGIGIDQDDEV
jgi:hypothetical protein